MLHKMCSFFYISDIPAPENISVNAHLSSVSVTWSKPPGVDVASYLVTLSSGGKCIKTVSTKYLNCCFPELEMGTEYSIGASTVQKKGGQGKPISKVIRLGKEDYSEVHLIHGIFCCDYS